MVRKTIQLHKDLRQSIGAGHPWIFDRALAAHPGKPGDLVDVVFQGKYVATGFYNPTSPIRVRILDSDPTQQLNTDWAFRQALRAAQIRRNDPRLANTNGLRLLHGENDYTPGLVVDLYDDTAVVVYDGDGPARFWSSRLAPVLDGLRAAGYTIARAYRRGRRTQGEVLTGDAPPELVELTENGARYGVDVRHGQKTGFFLDQRDNRARTAELARNATVLNLFCYTGGFSVACALGGAQRVCNVDIAEPAVDAAKENFRRSGLNPGDHEFVVNDAFQVLSDFKRSGRRFDLVICDPPSFAPNEKSRGNALQSYRKLNSAALDLVEPGGAFVTASCSSHITETDLVAVLAHAASTTLRHLRVQAISGPATDHPIRPAFPEGDYLRCLFARA